MFKRKIVREYAIALVVSNWDGEESDLVAIGQLRRVGCSKLEHQVSTTVGGGIVAEIKETRGVLDSELEGRERLSGGLRARVRGLWMWSARSPGAVNGNSVRFWARSKMGGVKFYSP